MKKFDITDYLFLTATLLIGVGLVLSYQGAKHKDGSMFMIGLIMAWSSLFPLSGAWSGYRRNRINK